MTETFWTLLQDKAHWEFEIFLMVIFDLFLGGMFWPFVRKHWSHHVRRDRQDELDCLSKASPGQPLKFTERDVEIFKNLIKQTKEDAKVTAQFLVDVGLAKWNRESLEKMYEEKIR